MDDSNYNEKKPLSIIQEIEAQLESYLRRQREEIEKALDEKIQKERELARQQLSEIEEKVKKEWDELEEYARIWGKLEEEGNQLLGQINDCLQRIINRQVEIERLARDTSEDIRHLNELQQRLEEVRKRSQEQADLVSRRLEEKFGWKAELSDENQEISGFMDLTPELEKLKKIKELLSLEQKTESEDLEQGPEIRSTGETETTPSPDENKAENSLEDTITREIKKGLMERMGAVSGLQEISQEQKKEVLPSERSDREMLETYYQRVQANGSGEIGYYRKEGKVIIEVGELLDKLKLVSEDAKKLLYKLALIRNKKEEFFLKQEVIRSQEGLRRYLQRLLLLVEKEGFRFPAFTQDIVNRQTLEELIELLKVQNWGTMQDIDSFESRVLSVLAAFRNRTSPESIYYAALKKELEA